MKNNLRILRREWDYSQEDAAAQICISREQWNRIESGKCEPSLSTALKICFEFDKSIDELFQLEDSDWTK